MTDHGRPHYALRKDGEFTWEIFNVVTGRTVSIAGKLKCNMPLDEADNEVVALNAGVLVADENEGH